MTTQHLPFYSAPAFTVTVRVILAVAGGYAAATAVSLLLAAGSDVSGRQEIAFIRMVFFLAWTVYIIWIFAINNHVKAFITALAINAVAWGLVWSGVAS
ncbi:hypothetical protein [Alteromonas sp. RKMC-009]|uniref:hypothetical protein n=1 Tax=Alteromonas sp. RKMC-009 TaxID=2267264 RepID=UPI000E678CDD|nr:hypothetical protein [Alteromonas sp. RKMC-009]AYA66233.1 hypothetical protein DS731_20720 [Alteromonas sp. RKMC-009]MEC7691699.1 hypothetical protein [Pseudomonadota bacterium]